MTLLSTTHAINTSVKD